MRIIVGPASPPFHFETLRVLALIYGHAALLAGRGVANRTFARPTPR
jgi:hypothetical protein